MTNVVPFPLKTRVVHQKPTSAEGPVTTRIQQGEAVIVLGSGEAAIGLAPFPYPSAPAVDPRYLKALNEQKGE